MAPRFKDYYETLGVASDANADDIKRAFRKLARKHHPDRATPANKDVAEAKFKEINEAYEVLGDPEKRKRYDQLGANWEQPEMASGWSSARRASPGDTPDDFDFHFGGTGFSDFFEQYFGNTRASRSTQDSSADIEAEIMVTLDEVLRGSARQVSLQASGAEGRALPPKTYQVRIPSGVREGQRIRLAGQGRGRGDLYLRVRIARHPDFRVENDRLFHDLELAPWEAVLGTTIRILTLDGRVDLRIKPGTQSGQQLRLAGLGLPRADGTRGDLHVVIAVEVPTTATGRERELWEELAKVSEFDPRH
ncbi:MAG TPA: J domain-containing protein [Opitutaceae bacterium]|nr:J domain-containing protein [Opitutaceae bacterium]